MPTQRDLQDALNALATLYAQQGGNPSARVPQAPVMPPTRIPGNYYDTQPLAGMAAAPSTYRPPAANLPYNYDPSFDPLAWVQGVQQYDPITGKSAQTPWQAQQMAVPGPGVPKVEGRPPPRMAGGTVDPSIPRLSPLDAPLAAEVNVPPLPGNGIGYGYVTKDNNARLLPGGPLDFIPGQQPGIAAIAQAMPPVPRPRPSFPSLAQVAAPMLPGSGPRVTSQKPYAGDESTPSLIPHLDPKMFAGMQQLATNPLAQLAAKFGIGMGGLGSALAGLMPSAATPNIPASGPARTLNGQFFYSGNTPGAAYDPALGWVVPPRFKPRMGNPTTDFTQSASGGSLVGSQ